MSQSIDALRWRCRMGVRELDELLVLFLDRDYASASPDVQQAFADLLTHPVPDVLSWVLGHESPQSESLQTVAQCLRRQSP